MAKNHRLFYFYCMLVTSRNISALAKIGISLLIWIPYLIYVYKFSSGFPFNDDYDMFLGSLINFENAQGVWNKLIVLFSQHMEHRPAFPRLVALTLVKLTGNCNFKTLIIIGNLMLMGTTLLITLTNNKIKTIQSILLNIAFILITCSLQSKENIFWATGALQNYSLIFFASISIYLGTRQKYIWAGLFTGIAICCSMSGFLIAPIIILIALYHKKISVVLIFLPFFTLIGFLYSMHYKQPDLSTLPGIVLQKSIQVKIQFFFAFLGSFASIKMISLTQAVVVGIIISGITVLLNWNYKKWDFWTFLSMFIILTALAGVNSRSELGAMVALSERYKIMSELLFICNMVKIFNYSFKFKTLAIATFLVVSTSMFYAQYRYYQSFVEYNKETTKLGVALFVIHKNPMLLKYPIPLAAAERLIKSQEMHIFTINLID